MSCVAKTCAIKEALSESRDPLPAYGMYSKFLLLATKTLTTISCEAPIHDESKLYNDLSSVFGAITTGIVVLRFTSKFALAGLSYRAPCSMFMALLPTDLAETSGPSRSTRSRTSVLSFTLWRYYILVRLFFLPKGLPRYRLRQRLWGIVIFNILYGIVFVFAGMFQCCPVAFYWKNGTENTIADALM